MAEIIEKRIVNDYIQCTMAIGSGGVYIPVGIYGRTWFMKKADDTVMECRVNEAGHCLVETEEGETERRCCVRYETPEGKFVNFSKYSSDGLWLYSSYEDAVRCKNGRKALIRYEVDHTDKHLYEFVSVVGMLKEMGFEKFEFVGTWSNLLEVYGFTYENCHLRTHLIKSTMWVDKDGLHIEPIIPEGVFKTKEEAYASNKPKLVTFADADDKKGGDGAKDAHVALLKSQMELMHDTLVEDINALTQCGRTLDLDDQCTVYRDMDVCAEVVGTIMYDAAQKCTICCNDDGDETPIDNLSTELLLKIYEKLLNSK